MTRCDECQQVYGELAEHRCPVYYTYPRLTRVVSSAEFDRALAVLQENGFEILDYRDSPYRLARVIEVGINLTAYGPAERHDSRLEKSGH